MLSSPGLTGDPVTTGLRILDCPVKPGNDRSVQPDRETV